MFIGTVATIRELAPEMTHPDLMQLLGATVIAFEGEFLGKSFVDGPARLIEAMDEAKRSGNFKSFERYWQQQAGSLVPTGVATISRAMDPAKTEVLTAINALRARLRGFSDDPSLPGRRDVFNQPMTYPHVGIEVLDAVNPWYVQRETADEKIKAIVAALEKDHIELAGPRNTIGGGDESSDLSPNPKLDPGVRLSPVLENENIRLMNTMTIGGQTWKEALYDLVTRSNDYREAGPLGRAILAKKLTSGYRKQAEAELIDRHPALGADIDRAKERRQNLIMPGSATPTPRAIVDQLIGTTGR